MKKRTCPYHEAADRRAQPRSRPEGRGVARLRPGGEVHLVDVSTLGARIEGDTRWLPGARVEIEMNTGGDRPRREARVVHCSVCDLGHGLRVRYQAGLAFDPPLAVPAVLDLRARELRSVVVPAG